MADQNGSSSTAGGPHHGTKPNPLRPMKPKARANPLVRRRPPPKTAQARPSANPAPLKVVPGSRADIAAKRAANGGWSETPSVAYSDIPIMTTKKAIMDGIRHHMIRFAPVRTDKQIDPTDQDEFARPVTLHRRDARQPPPGRAVKEEEVPEPEPAKQVDQAELERVAQIKAERDAQRAVDQAKIAPVIKDAEPKKPKKAKEEKISFSRGPRTAAAKKESEIRYEEALPWHLEDADGKNVWVGGYVSALSESNAAFVIEGGHFKMVPLEKWYRFTAKPPFQAYTIDQAEALMNKKTTASRWVMKDEERKAGQQDLEATRRAFYGKGPMIKTESDTFRNASRAEKMDHDELDVSGDEFQDDDETHTYEKQEDEDTKESQSRIRRDQLGANLFGEGDEKEVEKELNALLQEEKERERYGKATKKALIKRDKENIYKSDDSEENPWSSSDDDSSDEDGDDEDEDEDQKEDNDKKDAANNDKAKASGSNSKGSNTPTKGSKAVDALKKGKSLKRAGSPSESSGNESARKKPKVKKAATSAGGSRAGTPVPGAAKRKGLSGSAGSGSDGEATGGEMSDGAGVRKKKVKLLSSNRGTPSGSRAGSPNPAQNSASPSGSPAPAHAGPITAQAILDCLPKDGSGISSTDLMKNFPGRIGSGPGQIEKKALITLITSVCAYDTHDKKLRRRKDA